LCRALFASAPDAKNPKEVKENQSFTMNIFRGVVQGSQVYPYPDVLNEEQRDTLGMLVDPTEKFFEVCK
jgi:very long chain acyl-CoA dehydrogenase